MFQSVASLIVLSLLFALAVLLLLRFGRKENKKQDSGFPFTREQGK